MHAAGTGRRRRPPGRTFTAKGQATRQRIIAAAAELVFAHGVARTAMEDVQQRAGVSASQLYHYFTDKNDLIRAVIAHQTDGILAAQRPVLDELDSFAALEQWRDLLIDLQEERHCTGGCPIGSIAAEIADDDPLARADLAAGFERWEAPIRAGLARMRASRRPAPGHRHRRTRTRPARRATGWAPAHPDPPRHHTPTSRHRHRPRPHPNLRSRIIRRTQPTRLPAAREVLVIATPSARAGRVASAARGRRGRVRRIGGAATPR